MQDNLPAGLLDAAENLRIVIAPSKVPYTKRERDTMKVMQGTRMTSRTTPDVERSETSGIGELHLPGIRFAHPRAFGAPSC